MVTVRFLHTADWQLGMTRHFLSPEAQARYTDGRLAAIRALGRVAAAEGCEFVLVCGDVFESNQLSPQTLARALDAMLDIPVPVYLLPGNHDPLDAGTIYRTAEFTRQRPGHVHVLDAPGVHPIREGVEIVAAPWTSKRPLTDLVAEQVAALEPATGTIRIVAGHGAVDRGHPNPNDPSLIRIEALRAALADGRVHYVALGDRHSRTDVGCDGRVWYSGTPEVTDYVETEPGDVLVVDVGADHCQVRAHHVGAWRFLRREHHLNSAEDVQALDAELSALPDKERTVLKLSLVGTLTLREKARLDDLLARHGHLFAALEVWERRTDLVTRPDDDDFADLGLSGFAASALEELRELAAAPGEDSQAAQEALGLLYRLAGGGR
ncbi:metallophosphoesterase family protein [Carbonactinospora thermoautotrophica]|uniref:metallophosphoesterase family protein n=1 Tax=Carbonactinospora thermoautotrophica TaxID=1469144 RepID=UPI000AC69E84|nr:exonuclease SbcCD subunit D [Carbonactinospora thermoautotrophica]